MFNSNTHNIRYQTTCTNPTTIPTALTINPPTLNFITPTSRDVLLGRGGKGNHHPGNKSFLEHIQSWSHLYVGSDNNKDRVARDFVFYWKNVCRGRFLRCEAGSGIWFEIKEVDVVKKVKQNFRDGMNSNKMGKKQKKRDASMASSTSASSVASAASSSSAMEVVQMDSQMDSSSSRHQPRSRCVTDNSGNNNLDRASVFDGSNKKEEKADWESSSVFSDSYDRGNDGMDENLNGLIITIEALSPASADVNDMIVEAFLMMGSDDNDNSNSNSNSNTKALLGGYGNDDDDDDDAISFLYEIDETFSAADRKDGGEIDSDLDDMIVEACLQMGGDEDDNRNSNRACDNGNDECDEDDVVSFLFETELDLDNLSSVFDEE